MQYYDIHLRMNTTFWLEGLYIPGLLPRKLYMSFICIPAWRQTRILNCWMKRPLALRRGIMFEKVKGVKNVDKMYSYTVVWLWKVSINIHKFHGSYRFNLLYPMCPWTLYWLTFDDQSMSVGYFGKFGHLFDFIDMHCLLTLIPRVRNDFDNH